MKPSSMIFIAISVAIMIFGLLVCAMASASAENNGVNIFYSEKNESGDMVFTYDFFDDNIRKISIGTLGADVNLYSTSGNSYIELINFPDGSYTFSKTNKIIQVTNNTNISSILQFGTDNFSFDGLRHYFRGMPKNGHPKTVNIYINPENTIQSIVLSLDSGDLSLSSIIAECDYDISVTNGTANVSSLTSVGLLKFDGDGSNLNISDVSCDVFMSSQHNGSLTTDNLAVLTSVFAETDSGNITFGLTKPITDYKASLNAVRGTVNVTGSYYEYGYNDSVESNADINFTVKVNTGDITIK